MSAFNTEFRITTFAYDEETDIMTVVVQNDDPDSLEWFSIDAYFSKNRFVITEQTDEAGENAPDYAAEILVHFMRAWKKAYYAIGHDASPIDAFDTLKSFTVVIEA